MHIFCLNIFICITVCMYCVFLFQTLECYKIIVNLILKDLVKIMFVSFFLKFIKFHFSLIS